MFLSNQKLNLHPRQLQNTGVRGRKPKLAVVPETQMDISVVEEVDEIEEVELAPRPRQGSILPASADRERLLLRYSLGILN